MKLIGKRIERLNQFGDNLVIKMADEGNMRLSPALMSRLKIDANNNKIGFGYPEGDEEELVVYNAIDGDGVAVNKQGYIKNLPHNRDIRSYLGLPGIGDEEIYVTESCITLDEYPGMTFYKISSTAETVEETTEQWEEESNEQKAQDTINDLHQAIEKSGGEVVTTEIEEEDSLNVFGTN